MATRGGLSRSWVPGGWVWRSHKRWLAGGIADLAHRAIDRGHGDDGFAAIYDVLSTVRG
jgi:hypothetical protein